MNGKPPRARLGRTGIAVSPLCFGTIPLGPLRGMRPAEGAALLRRAYELGVNFIDTAELYENYETIRLSLRGQDRTIVVASKSYASDAAGMRASVEKARREMDRDLIDLFLLHEVESAAALRGHRAALDYLLDARSRGLVRAVGVSTHTVAGVRAAYALPEVDVIHPLLNRRGLGIKDGDAAAMADAISTAAAMGKGIYAMKVLAGGHLGGEAAAAFAFVRGVSGISSVAVGMRSEEEILINLAYLEGVEPPAELRGKVAARPRRLFVEPWCTGCGACRTACPFGALAVRDGRIAVREDRCLLCGYCAGACEKLCLKVV